MTQDKYTAWESIVAKTAKFVARDFPEVEEEDLFQDLMLYVLENNNLRNPDAEYVSTGLYKRATKLAWEYRKQALYVSTQYSYRTSDVRKILETAFDVTEWANGYVPEDAKEFTDDDKLIVHADVKRAFAYLPLIYQRAIFIRYALKETPDEKTDRNRLRRAVERLADILNFYTPDRQHAGPGNRRVMTNAKANYIIAEQDG